MFSGILFSSSSRRPVLRQPVRPERVPVQYVAASCARKGYQPSVSTSHEGQTGMAFSTPSSELLVFTTKFILALYTIYGTGRAESHQRHQGFSIERKEGGHILSPVSRQQGFKAFFF